MGLAMFVSVRALPPGLRSLLNWPDGAPTAGAAPARDAPRCCVRRTCAGEVWQCPTVSLGRVQNDETTTCCFPSRWFPLPILRPRRPWKKVSHSGPCSAAVQRRHELCAESGDGLQGLQWKKRVQDIFGGWNDAALRLSNGFGRIQLTATEAAGAAGGRRHASATRAGRHERSKCGRR